MTIRAFTIASHTANEAERLAIVDSFAFALGSLQGPPDPVLDALVAETAVLFAVPITLVSIVTRDEQCFPARVGLDATATPRAISFCGHAVLAAQTLVVGDATRDPRFAGNPLVLAAPFIRFYAGAPLVSGEGGVIGTLCIIDTVPRQASSIDTARLEAQARAVMQRLERLRAQQDGSAPQAGEGEGEEGRP